MARDKRVRDLRDKASSFLSKYDRKGMRALARAVDLWEQAAGPQVAARTRATAVRDGELLVYVDSNAWATELAAMGPGFAQAINDLAGEVLVRSVRFTVSRVVEQERRREGDERGRAAEPERVRPVPLTDEERALVEASVDTIEDPGLKDAARRAMTADLEWKKGSSEGPQDS